MSQAREFRWGAQVLPDPDPSMSPEEVRDYYSAVYPQLTTAAVEVAGGTDGQITFAEPKKAAKPGGGGGKQTVNFVNNQGKRG